MAKENKNSQKVKVPHGMRGVERPKNFKASMIRLLKYCKPYIIPFLFAVTLSIISAVFTIIGPGKIQDLIDLIKDGIFTTIDTTKTRKIVVFLGTIYLLSAAFSYMESYIMAIVTSKLSKRLRKEIIEKVNNLPLKYFDSTSYGDILSRVTNDVSTISHTLADSIANLISSVVLFIGVVTMMFITNYLMAITAIVATLIGFSLMIVILTKSQKYFTMQQEELGNINGHIEEIYSGLNVVKVYNGIDNSNKKFDKINDKLYESAKKSQFLSNLMPPIMSFIGNFGYVAICIVGSALVINGSITIGVIVSFMIYTRLFTNPLSTIAQAFSNLQSTAAAAERIFEFLDEKELEKEHVKSSLDKTKVKGNIKFDHVKFGYDVDKTIIHDFNIDVKSGQKVAIVGPTGAGKTTMVNLLMRFYEILVKRSKIMKVLI